MPWCDGDELLHIVRNHAEDKLEISHVCNKCGLKSPPGKSQDATTAIKESDRLADELRHSLLLNGNKFAIKREDLVIFPTVASAVAEMIPNKRYRKYEDEGNLKYAVHTNGAWSGYRWIKWHRGRSQHIEDKSGNWCGRNAKEASFIMNCSVEITIRSLEGKNTLNDMRLRWVEDE